MLDIFSKSEVIIPEGTEQNGNSRYALLTIVAALLALAATLFYFSLISSKKAEQEALTKSNFKPETFASENYQTYISSIENEITSKDLSEDVENALLYKKAIVMMDALEPNEAVREEYRIRAAEILREVYSAPVATKEGRRTKELTQLAFLLDFNQRFFLNGNTRLLPDEFSTSYMRLYQASSTRVITREEFQDTAFATYVDLSNSQIFSFLKKDKTLVSNRMYVTAIYLDSFHDKLSQEKRDSLLYLLKKDLDIYPTTLKISFTDPRHTELVADFYYAYAADVYLRRSGVEKTTELISGVQQAYEAARKNVVTDGVLSLTNRNMGQYIDAFYVSFLMSLKPKDYQEKIKELVREMNVHAQDQLSARSVSNFYTYFLSERGSWMGVKKNLLSLSKSNTDYVSYLALLNATLK